MAQVKERARIDDVPTIPASSALYLLRREQGLWSATMNLTT
jgi:hypothetical protein